MVPAAGRAARAGGVAPRRCLALSRAPPPAPALADYDRIPELVLLYAFAAPRGSGEGRRRPPTTGGPKANRSVAVFDERQRSCSGTHGHILGRIPIRLDSFRMYRFAPLDELSWRFSC